LEFRKDIEGLRAVAVIPIVLFHAGVSELAGGFVGVDLFFVISGFLITSIIFRDMNAEEFSLWRFYSRRVVRIFPPLLVMLVIVSLVGIVNLFPVAIRDLGNSVAAAAGFVSNLYFWREIDYFATAAELHPLLHTWSLGVEEQFYLFFPLFLLMIRRFQRHRLKFWLALATLTSFAIAVWLQLDGRERTAFYTLPSRAWELGLGAMVAVGAYPRVSSQAGRNALCLAGLGAIAASLFAIRADDAFPAPGALLPCLGAVLLIAYGSDAATSRLLGSWPMRGIGRISYSLYLWHWPIIAFYRINFGISLSFAETVGLVLASLAAALMSYAIVERPFLRKFRGSRPKIVVKVGLASAAATLIASMGISANAEGWRSFDPETDRILSYSAYTQSADYRYQFRTGECFIESSNGRTLADPACLALSDTKPNMVVAGDSLAAHYWRAISLRYPDYNVIQATAPSCRTTVDPVGTSACQANANLVLGPLTDTGKVESVVLSGRWVEADLPKLVKTIALLKRKGVRVLLVGPSVEYDGDYPEVLARSMINKDPSMIADARHEQRKELSDRMSKLAAAAGVAFVSPYDIQCPEGVCETVDATGAPTHFDCCHVTFTQS